MMNTETMKYQCGCGREYSSYPAYCTHKRLKHHNQSVEGTTLPKQFLPKRGRPSFSLPNNRKNYSNSHAALTIVELGLLKLQQKYPLILSQPEVDSDLTILNIYDCCQSLITDGTGAALIDSIRQFNQVIVSHTEEQISTPVSHFLKELTLFLLQKMNITPLNTSNQSQQKINRLETSLFNSFFKSKGQIDRTKQYAKTAGKPITFIYELTATLSQYLCKMGLLGSILVLKQ